MTGPRRPCSVVDDAGCTTAALTTAIEPAARDSSFQYVLEL